MRNSRMSASPFRRPRWGGSLVTLAVSLAGPAAAQAPSSAPPTQKIRVAVADLSGSALKMQSTTMPIMGGQPQPGYGQPTGSQTNTTIALPPPAEFARGLTEILTSVLIKTGRVTVLERAAMQQLDAEQALTAAGKVTKESGAQQGALLGAHAIITGDITGFAFNKSSVGGGLFIRGFSVSGEKVTAEVTIDLRLIDATTGEVIYSAKGTGKADQTVWGADATKGDKTQTLDAQTSTPLGHASREAIEKSVAALLVGMPKLRWSGRVIDVRNGVVYVNVAAADGMRPGLALDVFEAQPPLVDPATGQNMGAPERHVGTIVIDSVLEKFSTAKIASGDGIVRGHVLRLKPN